MPSTDLLFRAALVVPLCVAPARASGNTECRTRGGSWWYGQAQMRAEHLQSKPATPRWCTSDFVAREQAPEA